MPIDWGQLSRNPQPIGGVVAQLPSSPSGMAQAGQLGQGIMQGLAQGQAIQGQALQNKQLGMQNEALQQAVTDSKAFREAAKKGPEAVLAAHDQMGDITFRQQYNQASAQYDKFIADTALVHAQTEGVKADTKTKSPAVVQATQLAFGQIANSAQAVSQKAGPEAAQAQYDFLLAQLPAESRAVAEQHGFDKFTPAVYVKLTAGAMDAQANMLEEQEKKNQDPLAKNQDALESLNKQRNLAIHNNRDTAGLDKRITETQDRINTLSQGAGQNKFTHENTLRDEVNKQSIPFQQVHDAYGRVLAASKPDDKTGEVTGAGDLALIFNYMKMLDPGSTVREGEFATAQNSAGLPEILRAKYNKIMSGERMAPKTRDEFVRKARDLYKVQEQGYDKIISNYKGIAERNNLNPENSVQDIRVIGRSDESSIPTKSSSTPAPVKNLTFNPQTGRLE